MNSDPLSSSFRDPSGFLFTSDGILYRQVNKSYQADYELLMESGLYEGLVSDGLLIPHTEVSVSNAVSDDACNVLKPELVSFISYPYEWCFSQLKDAALATLEIQGKALGAGMSLKDCSAYNIQFRDCKPVLIDTLSFERYKEGRPWVAYRQFCQHFLAPLALMSRRDVRLGGLLRVYIDGIPLDLASSLLPLSTRFSFGLLSHIHLHARFQMRYAQRKVDTGQRKMSRTGLLGFIHSLRATVSKLKWQPEGTEWAEYYEDTNYSQEALRDKEEIVSAFLDEAAPKMLWDLGANTGRFSRIAAGKGASTIAFDIDPSAVEKNYLAIKDNSEQGLLPLLLDLTNPSPGIGWENEERTALLDRGPADAVMALALVHHLAISNNVPFTRLPQFFARICKWLIIEFVPKSDSQVERLLVTREDIFDNYTQECFEAEFEKTFYIRRRVNLQGSSRALYLMEKRQ